MMKRVGLASVSLLGSLSLASSVHAQGAAPEPKPAPAAAAPAAPTPSAAPAAPTPSAAPAEPAAAASGSVALNTEPDYAVDAKAEEPAVDDVELDRSWRATS